jgi:predicted RNase H-like HicB family nuclease
MKQTFHATVIKEDDLYVAQCLEVEIASQGKSEDEALRNLVEALELYFEGTQPTYPVKPVTIEVNIGAA